MLIGSEVGSRVAGVGGTEDGIRGAQEASGQNTNMCRHHAGRRPGGGSAEAETAGRSTTAASEECKSPLETAYEVHDVSVGKAVVTGTRSRDKGSRAGQQTKE